MKTLLALWIFGYAALVFADTSNHPAGMLLEDHDLVDRIYDVANDRFVSRQQLTTVVTRANFLLLGETHDNIRHHDIQREIIEELASQQQTVTVSFEMIDTRQGEAIKDKAFESAQALIDELEPLGSGWEYDTYYAELFDSVLKADMTMHPGNIDRQPLMDMVRGDKPLDPAVEKLLDQVKPDEERLEDLRQEIAASHCHMLGDEMIPPMVEAQRIRDAFMALSMARANADVRVLIAGNGHVRADRGVPLYLGPLYPSEDELNILTFTTIEVREDARLPGQYSDQWGADVLPFDYVWFTPRAQRQDPCEEMRQHMERRKSDS